MGGSGTMIEIEFSLAGVEGGQGAGSIVAVDELYSESSCGYVESTVLYQSKP